MGLFIGKNCLLPFFTFCILGALLFMPSIVLAAGELIAQKQDSKDRAFLWDRPQNRLDYGHFIQEADITELPEAYRPPYKGIQTVRPHKIGIMGGGRTPGIGFLFDYSFDRLGIGVSSSYRSFYGLIKELENTDLLGTGQAFWNAYTFYHFIPFNFSPYAIFGLELGEKTRNAISILFGIGMEIRIFSYGGWTVLLEYVYHKTDERAYPGISLGFAF